VDGNARAAGEDGPDASPGEVSPDGDCYLLQG
jgi:hypothetical protein